MNRVLASLLAFAVATPAFAVCPDFGHPNLASGPSIDLGGGLVTQSQKRLGQVTGCEKLFGEEIYMVQDCNSGASLWLYTHREEPKGNVFYDREAQVVALLDKVPGTTAMQDIAAIVDAAKSQAVDVWDIGAIAVETCMCAEIHPDPQGDKVPYEDVK